MRDRTVKTLSRLPFFSFFPPSLFSFLLWFQHLSFDFHPMLLFHSVVSFRFVSFSTYSLLLICIINRPSTVFFLNFETDEINTRHTRSYPHSFFRFFFVFALFVISLLFQLYLCVYKLIRDSICLLENLKPRKNKFATTMYAFKITTEFRNETEIEDSKKRKCCASFGIRYTCIREYRCGVWKFFLLTLFSLILWYTCVKNDLAHSHLYTLSQDYKYGTMFLFLSFFSFLFYLVYIKKLLSCRFFHIQMHTQASTYARISLSFSFSKSNGVYCFS